VCFRTYRQLEVNLLLNKGKIEKNELSNMSQRGVGEGSDEVKMSSGVHLYIYGPGHDYEKKLLSIFKAKLVWYYD
jgi:hypothetical protein